MPEKNHIKERPVEWIVLLILLAIIYFLGAPLALLNWAGYSVGGWSSGLMPYYAALWVIGALAVAGLWYWKRWGVFSMVGVWIGTVLVNRYFNVPINWPYMLSGVLLVIWFFWMVRRHWHQFG